MKPPSKHPTLQAGKPQVLSADLVVDAGVTAEAGEVPGNGIQLEIQRLQLTADDD